MASNNKSSSSSYGRGVAGAGGAAAGGGGGGKKPTLTPQQQAKTLHLEKDEAKRAEKEKELLASVLSVFQKFDTDNSGTISVVEFQELVHCLGLTLTSAEVQTLVDEIDTDKNGTIDFDEFFKWWKKGVSSAQVSLSHRLHPVLMLTFLPFDSRRRVPRTY